MWNRSVCGDVDGDGIDEIVWSCGSHFYIYRCTGPHQYERVWSWYNGGNNSCNLNLYDMNGNGYNEVIMSGSQRTFLFEIEAIRLLSPNGGTTYRGGDTCRIRWQIFAPPQCDSISLLLRKDTTWQLDTIVHGLAPSETACTWTVPDDIRSDRCHITAIAYGPGWQYDESDTTFSILPLGVGESGTEPIYETKLLGLTSNLISGPTSIRFQLREQKDVNLVVRDVTGRLASTLARGRMKPGLHEATWDPSQVPAGVYFISLHAGELRQTRRLIVVSGSK
jgi:hypothetical protein